MMLRRRDVLLISNPVCEYAVENLTAEDFFYYDKDGFELNRAEQKYYLKQKYPLNNCLNHICWQEPWFELNNNNDLILDHSLILHRARYSGKAEEQIYKYKKEAPQSTLLLQTKQKWGFDFAMDALDQHRNVYEVLHVEYDSCNYDEFINYLVAMEYKLKHIDWINAAQSILLNKNKWESLPGFHSNDWKSKFLLGWSRAEHTLKSFNTTYTP